MLAVELVFFRYPLSDGVVYALRCVAVVCCFLRLELVQEVVVLVVPFFSAVVRTVLSIEPLVPSFFCRHRLEAEGLHVYQGEALHLQVQLLHVPGGKLGDFIVCESERPDLFFVQIVCIDDRHLLQAQLLCSFQPCVPRYDDPVLVRHDRNLEAELPDGCGHLIDRVVVEPWVHRVRFQLVYAYVYDFHYLTLIFCPVMIKFLFLILFHAISCFCVVPNFFEMADSVSFFFTV